MSILAAVSAITPALMLLWYFSARNRYSVDGEAIWTAFAMGALVTIPIAIAGAQLLPLFDAIRNPHLYSLAVSFLIAATPEESAKLAVLVLFALRREDATHPVTIFILAIAVSLGFAMLENLAYVAESEDWRSVATIRAFLTVPSHAANGVVMGFFAARALPAGPRLSFDSVMMLLAPVIMHGLYNYPLFAVNDLAISPTGLSVEASAGLMGFLAIVVAVEAFLSLYFVKRMLGRHARARYGVLAQDPVANADTPDQRYRALVWLGTGGVLASAGGTFVAGWLAGSAITRIAATGLDVPDAFVAVLAIFPMAFGAAMFSHGLRILNRSSNQESAEN